MSLPGDLIEYSPNGDPIRGILLYAPVCNTSHGQMIRIDTGQRVEIPHNTLPELIVKSGDQTLPPSDLGPLSFGTMTSITGSDPEVFIQDSLGKVVPAWKFLPSNGNAITETSYNSITQHVSSIYWDGWQAEMTVKPRSCHEYLTSNVWHGLKCILKAAQKVNPTWKLLTRDVVSVAPEDLSAALPDQVALGCAPSLNAYDIPPVAVEGRELEVRFSGCHIHTSVQPLRATPWFPTGTVIMIDKIAGLLLTALGRDLEDPKRRIFYGRPGEYRLPTPTQNMLRLEYRTPGSFLLSCPQAFIFAADMVRAGMTMGTLADGRDLDLIPDVKDIIMNCDADGALKIINGPARPLFTRIFAQHYQYNISNSSTAERVKRTFEVLRTGIKPYLTDAPEKLWALKTNSLPANYRWISLLDAMSNTKSHEVGGTA